MNEIARRSGVTPPVVYDHFASKVALHQRLLERTRDELLAMWRDNLGGAAALEEQVARAFTAWALYVHANPYAPRVFFRETTGVEEVRRLHEEIAAGANDALSAIIGGLSPGAASAGRDEQRPLALQMAAEVIRGGLTELAIWWTGHPEVTSEEIVATAMDTVWIGLQQVSDGKRWSAPPP